MTRSRSRHEWSGTKHSNFSLSRSDYERYPPVLEKNTNRDHGIHTRYSSDSIHARKNGSQREDVSNRYGMPDRALSNPRRSNESSRLHGAHKVQPLLPSSDSYSRSSPIRSVKPNGTRATIIETPTSVIADKRPLAPIETADYSTRRDDTPEKPVVAKRKRTSLSKASKAGLIATFEGEFAVAEKKLDAARNQIQSMRQELVLLQQRMTQKEYEIKDIELVMRGLKERQQLQEQFISSMSSPIAAIPTDNLKSSRLTQAFASSPATVIDNDRPSTPRPPSQASQPVIKEEAVRIKAEKTDTVPHHIKKLSSHRMQSFYNTQTSPQLLSNLRYTSVPDGCARKLRTLKFNPLKTDIFAAGSDDGSVFLWKYDSENHKVDKLVTFSPQSFRTEKHTAENMAWSPDGDRLALAFREPYANTVRLQDQLRGEFCIVRLHQLAIPNDPVTPLTIPPDRIISKASTLQPRGITVIDWVPSGYGDKSTRGVVTAGANHKVYMWEETPQLPFVHGQANFKETFLHDQHRTEVMSLCIHSQNKVIYTGGADGIVLGYDLDSGKYETILTRRSVGVIGRMNSILEHPWNPHILMISSVEANAQYILFHDTREQYREKQNAVSMTLCLLKPSDAKSMSKYIMPRYAPDGFHVSCGSKNGIVHIWDLRAQSASRDQNYMIPNSHQAVPVHHKQVLHATWHARKNVMISISHDRNIGLLRYQ